jgi:hypothetical protein
LLLNNKTLTMYPANNDITRVNAFKDKTNSIKSIQAGGTFRSMDL